MPPVVAAASPVDAVEALEDALEVARRDADAVVAHRRSRRDRRRAGAPTSTGSPGSEYLIALSSRFVSALRTWRRSQRDLDVRRPGRRPAIGTPAVVGGGLHVLDRFASTSSATGTGSRVGASCASMRLRSSRSSTIRASRSALADDPLRRAAASRRRRRSAAIVSASSPSAPIGVFSSWLTLATKSRRTLSTAARFGDVARERHRADHLARRVRAGNVGGAAPGAAVRRAAAPAPPTRPASACCSSSASASSARTSPWRAPRKRCAAALRTTSRPMRSTTTMPSVAWSSAPTSQCCVASACATRSSASCFARSTAVVSATPSERRRRRAVALVPTRDGPRRATEAMRPADDRDDDQERVHGAPAPRPLALSRTGR